MVKQNVCKICRRVGKKLFLKGERCLTSKCPFVRRSYAPGQHGSRRRKPSDFAVQLREKQKVRKTYGLYETQFKNYYTKASCAEGDTAEIMLSSLERRLDNVVYRVGLSSSKKMARQIITHGYVLVNGKKITKPMYSVEPKDKIESNFKNQIKTKPEFLPLWIKLQTDKKSCIILHLPTKDEMAADFDMAQIIEYYSK